MAKRRMRWIDTVITTALALPGAADPGTIVNQDVLTEGELETIGTGATLIRVVGHLYVPRTAGTPVVTGCLWMADAYVGQVDPTDWTQDTFERNSNFWSFMYVGNMQSGANRFDIDIKSKRKISPGMKAVLALQNHAVAGNDANVFFHMRFLILLP